MRLRGRRRSANVEDHRGRRPAGGGRGGGRGAGVKIGGGAAILIALAVVLLGGDPEDAIEVLEQAQRQASATSSSDASPPDGTLAFEAEADLVAKVLADTEETWGAIFSASGERYPHPRLRLFEDSVSSACGYQSAAVGPFYCPADQRIFIDLSFFQQLARRHDAPGDFAQAYVVAHEVGHHVQNVLNVSGDVHRERRGLSEAEANDLSVRLELQADCLAGVWGHHAHRDRGLLEPGDLEEGLAAAAAIGDDTLQRRARGRVAPESFTHGSSAQRVRWFRRGFESGRVADCDTFGVRAP